MLKILVHALALLVLLLLVALVAAWLWLRAPDRPAAELERQYLSTDSRFVALHGGLRLHYRDQGDPSRPVILLLHGYGDSHATWEAWAKLLSDRYRVLSLDLPGHGLSAAPPGYLLDADALAALVVDVAAALRLPPFVLVGNSMGGGVAWKVALAAPERLRALVLVAAAGWPANTQGQSPSLAFRALQHPIGRWVLTRIDNKPLIVQGLKAQVHDPGLITDALVRRWADYQLYPGHRAILMATPPGSHAQATEEKLAAIAQPTLVLHGEHDPLIPVDNGRRFAAAIPGARLITYADAGHLPQREIPARSAADLADFLATLP
ncbi:alpha/beta hydrolase [Pelomonas sp. CA6]|uniref:alpha/beta fold hydrolase n=1 Tax=Pelomonas sp. CA6 TaxID=2907999 RepID=UPI001F4C1133|nr:alpha/beta hydrolase [Pelomonas sp. CA6]MCH7344808.1 alpha/beta hydrolase [Pelomonas sp. CA6]